MGIFETSKKIDQDHPKIQGSPLKDQADDQLNYPLRLVSHLIKE